MRFWVGVDSGRYYTVSKDAPVGSYLGAAVIENSYFPGPSGPSAETRGWNMMGAVLPCEVRTLPSARHAADGRTEAVRF